MASLRRVLEAEAGVGAASGPVLVGAAAPRADLADVDTSWPIAAAGAPSSCWPAFC
ncbi:MAG: hypothetical protein Q8K58_12475 [Acidimicrobiales bacterium]|nr:hypothetical protein [Acidimicrobiales bacterium]